MEAEVQADPGDLAHETDGKREAADEDNEIKQTEGVWDDFLDGDVFKIGDVLRLPEGCKSQNPPIRLEAGLQGIVRAVNEDGDPMLYLPDAHTVTPLVHWIDKDHFSLRIKRKQNS